MTKQSVTYERMKVTFDYPTPIRKGCCEACKRCVQDEEIKVTALHHTLYAFTRKTVKKNPVLALLNTVETCWGCHTIFDSLRDLLLSNPRGALRSVNRIMQVLKCLPQEQQDHFTKLCKTWLKRK